MPSRVEDLGKLLHHFVRLEWETGQLSREEEYGRVDGQICGVGRRTAGHGNSAANVGLFRPDIAIADSRMIAEHPPSRGPTRPTWRSDPVDVGAGDGPPAAPAGTKP